MEVKQKWIEQLQLNGFQIAEALHFCAGKESIYRTVLETALEEGRQKLPLLKRLGEEQYLDRYYIEVHGLKNAAQTIGAARLFELAKQQCERCKMLQDRTEVEETGTETGQGRKEVEIEPAGLNEMLLEYGRVLQQIETAELDME